MRLLRGDRGRGKDGERRGSPPDGPRRRRGGVCGGLDREERVPAPLPGVHGARDRFDRPRRRHRAGGAGYSKGETLTFPRLLARIIPWNKETAVAAIESGVEALWVPDGRASSARELGRVVAACAEGDVREGIDFRVTRMEGKEDEARVAGSPPDAAWVVFPRDREIIPLENLVAWGRRVLVVARTPAHVSLYRGVLEKGVYGLVLDARDPAGVRALAAAAPARAGG